MTDRPRRVVYTALMGGYEELLPQPAASQPGIDFVCFTDDATLRSDDWEVRLVRPTLAADRIRSSRALKIVGHPSLAGYDESLWIDNRVELLADTHELFDRWLDGADLAAPRHSFRADVVSEFQAVLDAGLDDTSRLYEQLTHYSALDRGLLTAPVAWTGMLARRRTPEVDAGMAQWWLHVVRYSRRDQLSFVQSLHESGLGWRSVDVSNLGSSWHTWRQAEGRSTRPLGFQVAEALQPPVAELGELRIAYEQTVADLAASLQSREQALQDHEQSVQQLERDNAELRALHDQDQLALGRLRDRVHKVRRKKRHLERELARATTRRRLLPGRASDPDSRSSS